MEKVFVLAQPELKRKRGSIDTAKTVDIAESLFNTKRTNQYSRLTDISNNIGMRDSMQNEPMMIDEVP